RAAGKDDEATSQQFQTIWAAERPALDALADSFALGNADAARLLADARDTALRPGEVPALFKDKQLPGFFRANLALAYAKSLTDRKVYEEALQALQTIRPEDVVDPAGYFFHKALAEFSLGRKAEAQKTIAKLTDVVDAPDRYQQLAVLMKLNMDGWKNRDLADATRRMQNVGRRLDLARGGPETQRQQREIVRILDELIEQHEPHGPVGPVPPGPPGPNEPHEPGPGPVGPPGPGEPPVRPGGNANQSGPGNVDNIQLAKIIGNWGKLPEKERAQIIVSMTRHMPPQYRQAIEEYFRRCGQMP
ncbi:MAG: hypothetical protein JNM56_34305, partial [Planctomycetia bacterium]|nr:hypothetical protein [Planctomycetia bacterium]